jgi:hypothetical protein
MEHSSQADTSTIGPLGDVGTRALEMFDSLVAQGKLFYELTKGEVIEDNGFKVSCRLNSKRCGVPRYLSFA